MQLNPKTCCVSTSIYCYRQQVDVGAEHYRLNVDPDPVGPQVFDQFRRLCNDSSLLDASVDGKIHAAIVIDGAG